MANQMTDERREELIGACWDRMVEADSREDKEIWQDAMYLLIDGRSKEQVLRLEEQRGLR